MTKPVQELTAEKVLEAVLTTMKAEPYCFLITVDESGQPHARMMGTVKIEPDVRVWMFASPESRKAMEIRGRAKAALAFPDNKGEGYVTLSGNARLVSDASQKKALWQFSLGAFFPGGPDGDDSVLIEFVPDRIEIMHFHLKVGVYPWTFKPATLVRSGESWTIQR